MQLRYFCENWRQPFQKDYTQSSVRRAFEQLLALRADLEEAIGGKPSSAAQAEPEDENTALMMTAPAVVEMPAPPRPAAIEEAPQPEAEPEPTPAVPAHKREAAKPQAEVPAAPTAAAEGEKVLEAIWEQLIAAPPSRGRSMSTVVLQDTKVLLSTGEVAAFVTEGGQDSEDLRRAVVARALLSLASEKRKRSGEERALASALVLARAEVSYFQGRVEQAKRAKNTEAAVNLGISTKRLLSAMEEAETLQP